MYTDFVFQVCICLTISFAISRKVVSKNPRRGSPDHRNSLTRKTRWLPEDVPHGRYNSRPPYRRPQTYQSYGKQPNSKLRHIPGHQIQRRKPAKTLKPAPTTTTPTTSTTITQTTTTTQVSYQHSLTRDIDQYLSLQRSMYKTETHVQLYFYPTR